MLWDVGRVEWKYGRTDDGKPKNWSEWDDVRVHLREAGKLRQPQELDSPNVKVWHGGESGCQSEAKEGRWPPLPLPSCSESSSLVDGITLDGCSTSADTPESTPLPELPGWPLAQLPEHEHEWPQPVPPHPIVHVSRSEIENCPLCQCIAAPTDPADSSQ